MFNVADDGTIFGILLLMHNIVPYLYPLFLFVVGCIALYYCSEVLIDASILLSQKFNLSPITIGATVVALGTSLPELLVSLYSTFFIQDTNSANGIILGNILGSNIANISLVLGFCALLYKKIKFESNIFKDLLFIFFLGLYALACLYYEISINYFHGICLIVLFLLYLYYLVTSNQIKETEKNSSNSNLLVILFVILISIIGLAFGTDLSVKNAIVISSMIGFNELAIGISIVALGTSFPELFTGISAIKKKKYSLLIGNVIGSNIINVVFVLGFSSLFRNIIIEVESIISFVPYIMVVFILSHLFLIISYLINKSISFFSGLFLLSLYLYFIYHLIRLSIL